MSNAINIVRKFFPDVQQVVDATRAISVDVTKRDSESATVRNHKGCAMAVACKRKQKADGVIISVGTAYVIKGKTAIRFKVPESVSREVVSFDRHGGFSPGEYNLRPPRSSEKLGSYPATRSRGGRSSRPTNPKKHHTKDIRTVLGSGLQ